jgi:predicted transposase YdaD
VTPGQQIFEQGKKEGRQEGRQQGLQELLLRLLRQRFGVEVSTHVEQRVAAASVEQIEAWSMRVLSATTLAEVLAD